MKQVSIGVQALRSLMAIWRVKKNKLAAES